jgi:type III secretion protein D
METPELELRVLMGLQAGARLRLAEGRYVLGNASTADVVLAGPRIKGEHAAVTVTGGQASVVALAGTVRLEDGTRVAAETVLKPGQYVDCEGVWVSVDRTSSPWPDLDSLIAETRAPREASAPAATGEPAASATPPPSAPERAAPSRPRPVPGSSNGGIAAAAVALAVVACFALAWAWIGGSSPPQPPKPALVIKDDAEAQTRSRIAALGLESRLAVQRSGSSWTVSGAVPDEAARDALTNALSGLRPRPAIKLATDEENAAAAARLIARAALPARLETLGPAKARLTVAAPNRDAAERLAQALREELVGVRELETEFLTLDKLVPALQVMTDNAGLAGKVLIAPADATSAQLTATGSVNRNEMERWNRLLREFRERYGTLAPVRVALIQIAPPLPFAVRSVVGGDAPHVITAEGERVFPGGRTKGYLLVEIRSQDLVFQGAERIVVPRPKGEALERKPAPR